MLTTHDPFAFAPQVPKQVYQQIREHVRAMLVQGALPVGSKLPSTKQLAAKWQVPAATVQTAMSQLVKEGLLVRIRKKGTFVLDRESRLERIGTYFDTNVWSPDSGSFKRAVHLELLKLGAGKGITFETFFDSRKQSLRTKPLLEIVQAVESRRIQALIATDIAINEAVWIAKLPIPSAVFVEAQHPAKIDFDFNQFINLGLQQLKEAGCRSVGIISLRGPWKPSVRAVASNFRAEFVELFSNICETYNIATDDLWIRTAEDFVEGKAPQEEFGYTRFLRIWELPNRPDGLIVYPNSCCVGAITGVLEKRSDVPRDLKLVFHKHRELNYLCPLPVSFVYSSAAEVAKALLNQATRQFRGEDTSQVIIPFSLNPDPRP